jgi:hypothetical protein
MPEALTLGELEAETVLELPDRETLALVVIRNVANNNRIKITVQDINVGVQVCALVEVIDSLTLDTLTCTIKQR